MLVDKATLMKRSNALSLSRQFVFPGRSLRYLWVYSLLSGAYAASNSRDTTNFQSKRKGGVDDVWSLPFTIEDLQI
jgi:hypothetical protein